MLPQALLKILTSLPSTTAADSGARRAPSERQRSEGPARCATAWNRPWSVAIGLAAREDAQDFDRVAVIVKSHAITSDAKTIFGRVDVGEPLDVAFFGEQEAGERFQEPNRCCPVNRANVGTGRRGPDYFLRHCFFSRLF
jgi:hypothetical protein